MSEQQMETVAQMAKRLNCSPDTVRRMIRNDRIPSLNLGGSYRLEPEKVILALSRDEPNGGK